MHPPPSKVLEKNKPPGGLNRRFTVTITEISKENGMSQVVKIGNHALRCYAQSRLTRLIWVPSRVTENPSAALEKVYSERNVKSIVSFSIHSKRP